MANGGVRAGFTTGVNRRAGGVVRAERHRWATQLRNAVLPAVAEHAAGE